MQLNIEARDPDCAAPPCTTTCGTYIRGDQVTWTDDTGRTGMFANYTTSGNASPWSGSIQWTAPATEGTAKITVSVPDNGGMLCGGKKTTVATLDVVIANARPPAIESFTVTPSTLRVGATAQLSVVASDPLGRALTYQFSADAGTIQQDGIGPTARWTAPNAAGQVVLRCTVSAGSASSSVKAQTTALVQIGDFEAAMNVAPVKPLRIAPSGDGRLAFVDSSNGQYGVFDTSRGIATWSGARFAAPVGLAVELGEVFVADRNSGKIGVFNLSGDLLREIQLRDIVPNGLATGPNRGELTITDTMSGRAYVVSSSTGATLRDISTPEMIAPAGVAVARGRIAIADPMRSRVFIFDQAGALQATFGDDTLLSRPQGVAWDSIDPANVRLAVVDAFTAKLTIFSANGTVLGTLGGWGTGEGQLLSPIDIALVSGNLAVTTASGNIVRYSLGTTLPPLAAPTNVTTSDRPDDNGDALGVSWTLSADDPLRVTGYRIERSADATGIWQTAGFVGTGTRVYTDERLSGGTCYRYRVVATDGVMEGISAETPCIVPQNELAPATPASLTATVISSSEILLNWAPVAAPDLATYSITIAPAGGTPAQTLVSAATVEYAFTGLTRNTAYAFELRAIDAAGLSSGPASASARTLDDVAPSAPALTVRNTSAGGELEVDWVLTDSLPIALLTITAEPVTPGWPVVTKEITGQPVAGTGRVKLQGLVNRVQYRVYAVTAVSATRISQTSTPVTGIPTAAPRQLPVVQLAGWAGSGSQQDAAGITVFLPVSRASSTTRRRSGSPEAGRVSPAIRELKFEYRTLGASIQPMLDGVPFGTPLRDTTGTWAEASINIEKALLQDGFAHTLEFRNTGFPSPVAEAAVRKVDYVPLPVEKLASVDFNTVIDLTWGWLEARNDLMVSVARSAPDGSTHTVLCDRAQLGRCRDTFLLNGVKYQYTLAVESPAGWKSTASETSGSPNASPAPPPVTDVNVVRDINSAGETVYVASWTPVSTELQAGGGPQPVVAYRVYVSESGREVLVAETQVTSTVVTAAEFYPGTQTLVVRSVDALGRESK